MELIGRIVLVAAMLAAPWPFGSVTPQPQWWLCLTIAGLTLWRLVETVLRRPDQPCHIPVVAIAPVGLLLIAAVQLLPREEPLVPQMEHAVFAEWADSFTADVPEVGTVAPAATRSQASRLFFALAAFFLAVQWFSTPSSQIWLWRALAVNGAILAFFGIVQKITWNGLLFWSVPLRYGGVPFASFVNRNNAAGYLNLCLAAGLGWLFFKYGQRLTSHSHSHSQSHSPSHSHSHSHSHSEHSRSRRPQLPWKVRVLRAISTIDGPELAVMGLLALIAAAILFSLSRGGILAMVVGFAVTLGWQRGLSRSAIILFVSLLGAAAIGMLLWVGGWDVLAERLTSLSTPVDAAEGRLQHWWDVSRAVMDFPILGTGLGTYRYANLPYQVHFGDAWYINADNHYLEMLVETGMLGLMLYVGGFVLTVTAAVFLVRQERSELRAVGTMGLFAVVSQAVQAVTDFGLLIPANAMTFAVLCGAVCGTACAAADFHHFRSPAWLSLSRLEGRWNHVLLGVMLTLTSAAFGLEVFVSTQTALARNVVIRISPHDPLATREELLEDAIEGATKALKYHPGDPELHRATALWWIDRYHLRAARELSESADPENRLSGRRLWQVTSVRVLNARVNALTQLGEQGQVELIRQLPLVRDYLIPARRHLLEAASHGPLTRDVSRYLAHLSFLTDGTNRENWQDEMAMYWKRALFITPSSADQLFEAGVLAKSAGRTPLADRAFSRCLAISEDHLLPIWSLIFPERSIEDLLERVIPNQLNVLVSLAEHVPDKMIKSTLAVRAERVLNEGDWEESGDPSHLLQARLAELLDKPDQAIQHYRLALGDTPRDIETRLQMAQLLLREGRLQEAEDQFSLLHHLAPNRNDIKTQFEKLKLRDFDVLPDESD